MNGDPYRAPQTPDRRVINRSAQASQRPPEQPQLVKDEPQPTVTPRSYTESRLNYDDKKSSKKGWVWTVIIALIVIALVVGGWALLSSGKKTVDTGIDASKYQAVFLTNGQIYFGNLQVYNDEYLKLTTGYYPQAKTTDTNSTDKDTTANSNGIQLIRLGDEVYGPEDAIFISKEQVLHYENLKSDSKVAQLIAQNEKAK